MSRFCVFVMILLRFPGLLMAAQQPGTSRPAAGDTMVVELPAVEVVVSILPATGPLVGSGIPARVRVVPGALLNRYQPRLLSDAMAAQPGISIYDDLGSPYKTTLMMRGFAASPVVGLPQGVSVFVDGVPINEPDAGQVNFDLIPLRHAARLELMRGTASLLGPYSLGGAVNLVTRQGHGPASGELEVTAGSYGAYSGSGSIEGSSRGWSYYAGGGHGREEGWRRLTSANRSDALVNLGRLGPARGFWAQGSAARSRAETAGSLPASVYTVQPDSNLSAGDFEDLAQVHLALSGYAPAGAGRSSFRAYFRAHDAERFNVNQITDPDVRSFSENRTLGASADWRWAGRAGDAGIAIRGGLGGSINQVEIRIFAERLDPGLTTHVESPISDLGAYAVADYSRGRVAVTAGLRYDAVRVPFRNRLDPARDTTSTFLRLSPRGGASLDLGGGASIHASIGRSFRAPAVIELACADPENPCPLPFALGDDPPLEPVVVTTLEAGGNWARGITTLGASVYRSDVSNDIFLFPFEDDEPEGSTIDGFFGNIDRTRRAGAELDARLLGPTGHSVFASYAFTRATFQATGVALFSIRQEVGGENEIERGDRFPLVPAHTASGGVSLALPREVAVGVSGRYVGRRWLRGDEANEEEPLGAYVITDLSVGHRFAGWEIRGIVENLFDRTYAAFGTFNLNQGAGGALERFLTPGQPRTVRVVVRRKFGRTDLAAGRAAPRSP